jgi:hypothetical protein
MYKLLLGKNKVCYIMFLYFYSNHFTIFRNGFQSISLVSKKNTKKQGPNWGYWAQYGVIIGLYGPKTVSKLGLLGPKRCQSCQIH